MATRMNDSVHVQIQIVKLYFIGVRLSGINRYLVATDLLRLGKEKGNLPYK